MAETGKARRATPRAATKVAAPARTAARGGRARTAALPAAEVEEQAVDAAVAAPVKRGPGRPRKAAVPPPTEAAAQPVKPPRPSRQRPAALAAAAMRAEPEPDPDAHTHPEDAAEQHAARGEAAAVDADGELAETAQTVFLGRTITVKPPTDEQLIMYRRLAREFQDLTRDGATESMSLDAALRQMDRAVRLVQSVLADERDREWIEDQLLEGKITLAQCTGLLTDAFKHLRAKREEQAAAHSNRATRRAPTSRARLADD